MWLANIQNYQKKEKIIWLYKEGKFHMFFVNEIIKLKAKKKLR